MVVGLRASAAALVVEEQVAPAADAAQREHLRQQVIVMGAWSAVQYQKGLGTLEAIPRPVQRYFSRRRETEGSRWRHWARHGF